MTVKVVWYDCISIIIRKVNQSDLSNILRPKTSSATAEYVKTRGGKIVSTHFLHNTKNQLGAKSKV